MKHCHPQKCEHRTQMSTLDLLLHLCFGKVPEVRGLSLWFVWKRLINIGNRCFLERLLSLRGFCVIPWWIKTIKNQCYIASSTDQRWHLAVSWWRRRTKDWTAGRRRSSDWGFSLGDELVGFWWRRRTKVWTAGRQRSPAALRRHEAVVTKWALPKCYDGKSWRGWSLLWCPVGTGLGHWAGPLGCPTFTWRAEMTEPWRLIWDDWLVHHPKKKKGCSPTVLGGSWRSEGG